MFQIILWSTLSFAAVAEDRSSMALRLTPRTCLDLLSVSDEFFLRNWISTRVSYLYSDLGAIFFKLHAFSQITFEHEVPRNRAVDRLLGTLADQDDQVPGIGTVEARRWQLELLTELDDQFPRGLIIALLGDRLVYNAQAEHLDRGEFIVAFHWDRPASPSLVENLAHVIEEVHGRPGYLWHPLRSLRSGTNAEGDLYVALDAAGDPESRFLLTLSFFRELNRELIKWNARFGAHSR